MSTCLELAQRHAGATRCLDGDNYQEQAACRRLACSDPLAPAGHEATSCELKIKAYEPRVDFLLIFFSELTRGCPALAGSRRVQQARVVWMSMGGPR